MPRWYDSQIYAGCQQNLFSSEHDTNWRILLVTFLAEQKRVGCVEITIFDAELVFLC